MCVSFVSFHFGLMFTDRYPLNTKTPAKFPPNRPAEPRRGNDVSGWLGRGVCILRLLAAKLKDVRTELPSLVVEVVKPSNLIRSAEEDEPGMNLRLAATRASAIRLRQGG